MSYRPCSSQSQHLPTAKSSASEFLRIHQNHFWSSPTSALFLWKPCMCLLNFKISLSLRAEMTSFKDRIKSFVSKHMHKNNNQQSKDVQPTTATQTSDPAPVKNDKPYFMPATLPAQTTPSATANTNSTSTGPPGTVSRVAAVQSKAATATGSLQVQLENQSTSSQVYAYISKLAHLPMTYE